jgi:hypothetical protein
MKKTLLLALFLSFSASYAQNYAKLIKKADSCYTAKNYALARDYYAKAFKTDPKSKRNYYNAACAASLANDKKNAIKWLETAIQKGYEDIYRIKSDTDLENIRKEKKFITITEPLQKKIALEEANYDKLLQQELLAIHQDDQGIRYEYIAAQKKYGNQSKEADSLGKIMGLKDSLNLLKIVKILDEKGWVGKNKVGREANQAIYLVIQHADLKTQQKYLPMMREAVKKGNATPSSLAFLEDRVAFREGRKQIYGTQVGTHPVTKKQYVLPLEDPDHVDERRSEMGLGTLEEYLSYWDISWDVEQYKKDLPELEKLGTLK